MNNEFGIMGIQAFIIVATSADGFIARQRDQISTNWTSKSDKEFFKERTKKAGVIVMGEKTFETIGKPLPGRVNIVYSIENKKWPGVETTQKEPKALLEELSGRGFSEVAICGGASIYTLFAKSGLVSKIYMTVEPLLFGDGIKLFNEPMNLSLSLAQSKQLGENVLLLEYLVK